MSNPVGGTFDPISLEILWRRLIAVADEIDTATIRTSFSSIVGESHDFGCVVMDQNGHGLVQAQWSPPHFCTTLPITTRKMLERFPRSALRPGDVLITNDPWLGTGHLPDFNVVTPVFHREQLVAFLGTVAHVADVGGHLGDLEAVDVFQEGFNVPPCRFFEAGAANRLVHEFITANCRVPDMVMGDLHAIVGTHRVGARHLQELLDDYDLADLAGLSRQIIERSEGALRRAIAALPGGVNHYEVTADGYIEPFTLRLSIDVRGDEMYFDFAGTSPQQRNVSINSSFNMTVADVVYPIKCMLAPGIPNNDGLVRPLHVTAPEGSIVHCRFPAPVRARAKVGKHIPPLIFGVMAPLLPGQAIAAAGGIFPFRFIGEDSRFGTFAAHVLPHGGVGATEAADGWPPAAFPDNSTITPAEIMEVQCPVMMLRKALLPDSGGAGRRRGGLGQEFVLQCVAEGPITLTIRPDLLKFPAPGLAGGHPGRRGEVWLNGQQLERFPPLEFRPGDVCVVRLPGGGGFGPPEEREADRVAVDVANGLVSENAADRIYGRPANGQRSERCDADD
ncbi:MAG: hydantoinase B/oxoprolinase family protein [Thermaerobacterales bacterium]